MKMSIVISILIVSFSLIYHASSAALHLPLADTIYTYQKKSYDGIGKYYLGREISYVMGAAGSDWLERDSRQEEEITKLAIQKMNLPKNAIVADIGAGTGYYSFKIAAKVTKGKVYAVDVQDELLDFLAQKKAALRDTVITVIKGSEKSPNLPANSIDLAIMVDVYHELEYPHEMLQSIKTALKKDGKILLIEYRGEDPTIPIKALHKTTVEQLKKELGANGFDLSYRGDFLPIQHFLLFGKKQ
jgi:SAM-dependent methyltransferase